jgi:hypothetical protein
MTGMSESSGAFEPQKNEQGRSNDISRPVADLVVRFTGREFVPSGETPLGVALIGNLSKRVDEASYIVHFKEPYTVDLCIGGNKGFTPTPLLIQGFVLGTSPSGQASVLGFISADRKKIKLPVVMVAEEQGEWRLFDTPLGWNRDLIASAPKGTIGGARVSFNERGAFLVVLHEKNDGGDGTVPMPIHIHSVTVSDERKILKARSNDGRVFTPEPIELDLRAVNMPVSPEVTEEDYSLQPIEKQLPEIGNEQAVATPLPDRGDVARAMHESKRTRIEAHDFKVELALRRLMMQEKRHASKENSALIVKIMTSAAAKESKNETSLSDSCKNLALKAGGNPQANLFADMCRKWIRHHQDRSLWKELVWKEYYEDLVTIAPLLSRLEGDLNRMDTSGYEEKLKERRKR